VLPPSSLQGWGLAVKTSNFSLKGMPVFLIAYFISRIAEYILMKYNVAEHTQICLPIQVLVKI
jgi:hypothetical protein